ncbi:hypothetical protein, partial [Shigella sonnei]|uniref:hypothetical protein n=1 Tax=Shigella sonnei TaxID=624 RepID=UPI001C0A7D45
MSETAGRAVQAAKTGNGLCWELTHVRCDENDALFASSVSGESIHDKGLGFAPIFPDICYHLTHYKPAAADIPV